MRNVSTKNKFSLICYENHSNLTVKCSETRTLQNCPLLPSLKQGETGMSIMDNICCSTTVDGSDSK